MADTLKHKKAVFIVEDDAFLSKACQAKFEKEGIEVWIAHNGTEAMSYLTKDAPGVVLLDLMLPGASGFDVLAEMRKHELWAEVPVIILSNLGQAQDIERAKALGATDYIVKAQVALGEVVERVKKIIS